MTHPFPQTEDLQGSKELQRRLKVTFDKHRHNHRLVYKGFAVGAALLAVNLPLYYLFSGVGFYAMIGSLFIFSITAIILQIGTEPISKEDNALTPLAEAWKLLEALKLDPSDSKTKAKAIVSLRNAASELSYFNPSPQIPTSSVAAGALDTLDSISKTIDNKIIFAVEKAVASDDYAKVVPKVEALVTTLLEPNLDSLMNYVGNRTSDLEPRPKTTRGSSRLHPVMETRLGQLIIAISFAVLIPPVVVWGYAEALGYAPFDYARSNGPLLITGFFLTFLGILAWLGAFRQRLKPVEE